MNGQSNGSPKGMLGKKMFSLIAVALMVASCLVVVAAVDDSKATSDTEYSKYTISKGGQGWEISGPTIEGVSFNGTDGILTFREVNAVFNDNSFIFVQGGQLNENEKITVEFIGQNTITIKPTGNDVTAISITQGGIDIIGKENAKLILNCDSAVEDTNYTAIMPGKSTIKNISIEINISGKIKQFTGFNVGENFTVTNSQITIGSAPASMDISTYTGIYVQYDVNISNSLIIINTSESGKGTSYGFLTTSMTNSISIVDSCLFSTANSSAVCTQTDTSTYVDWPNNFTDLGVQASYGYSNPSYEQVTANTIDKDYKSVIIGSYGNTLSFDKDGGEGRVPESVKLASGEHYTIPACKLTKDGSSADGWVDSNGKVYHAGDDFVMGDSDVVLKPHWNTGIGVSMTILAIIIFFSILLIIGIVFAVRKYEE